MTKAKQPISRLRAALIMANAFGSMGALANTALDGFKVRERGKGRKSGMQKSHFSAHVHNGSGKYMPHQGAKESARRYKQMKGHGNGH
jgi:hypothetical protein